MDKIKNLLKQNSLDAALISSLPNIVYLADFSHFTEIEREGFILITKKSKYIFTDARYSHAVKLHLPDFKLFETSINNSFEKLLQDVIIKENIKILGIEENNLTITEHKRISEIIKNTKHFDLKKLRLIKHKNEIEKIKKACEIGDKAFSYILKKIKLGMTEKEVAFELEQFIRKSGCETSFPTIIAFEENAAIPHHKTGNRKLKINELILIDFGVKYENYCSDMTRTISFGKANPEKKKVYQAVLNAQNIAIKQFNNEKIIKPIKAAGVDKIAREYILTQGYPSIPHSLGHGIGLQVHEAPSLSPKSKNNLSEGMVFSLEPGIYLPGKFGIRIEDLFMIKNGRLIQITKSPKDLIDLKT